jgi:endonuclease/exonuclease/phosphatase family metal-dependent hydrolase
MKWIYSLIVIVATAMLGDEVWEASRTVTPEPAAGTSFEGRATSRRPSPGGSEDAQTHPAAEWHKKLSDRKMAGTRRTTTLRFGTFNIHGGTGDDGRYDLDRVADCLRDLDVVALNEVHGQAALDVSDQAKKLGERLGMQWLFAPAEMQWYCREFGNGLLTRVPVTFWQWIPLPRHFDQSYRNMVLANLECRTAKNEPRTIHLLLTHVHQRYDAERRAQLQAVIAMYLALAEPVVLLGDLNSDADDPQIRQLLRTPGVSDAVGEKLAAETPGRIDWIIVRGLRCVDAGVRNNGASDHPLVWAELESPQ